MTKAKAGPRRFLFSQEGLDEYKRELRVKVVDECLHAILNLDDPLYDTILYAVKSIKAI